MNSTGNDLGQVLGIGEHCSVDYCRQIDFLPFKCDCCSRTFCLEHRSYTAHSCPSAGAKETTVIVCPICAKSVRLNGQDPNEVFDAHQRTDCDPANYAKVHKKPKCPVIGCKEKLTTINVYRCKHCTQRVCLRHRDPGDHGCAEVQATLCQQRGAAYAASNVSSSGRSSAASSRPTSAPRAATGIGPSATTPAAAPPAPATRRALDAQQRHAAAVRQYEDPENSVRGTAARRAQQAQQQAPQQQRPFQWPWQQQQHQPPPQQQPPALPPAVVAQPSRPSGAIAAVPANSNANPLVPPHLPESCPQCGARFATVERLIQHVEDFHPSAEGRPGASSSAPLGGAPPAAASASPQIFTNPLLRGGLSSTTIAGGQAPAAVAAGPESGLGMLRSGAVGRAGAGCSVGGTREEFRCYFCSQTFNDPVLLVQHSDRCSAARGAAGAGGSASGARGGGGGGSGTGSGGGPKDSCVVC